MPFTAYQRRVYDILDFGTANDGASRLVDGGIMLLIGLNILAILLESVDTLYQQYQSYFSAFEVFSVVVFSIEYVLRLWSCPAAPDGRFDRPWGRLRYSLTPMALIDLISIAPFYLSFFFVLDLRFMRVLRLFRIFKFTRYSYSMEVLVKVFRREASMFSAVLVIFLVVLVISSSGIYLFEEQTQSDVFSSIPAAFWWSVTTLTSVGYGDVYPVTTGGKIFGALVQVAGVLVVALPTGIISSAFTEELRRKRRELDRVVREVVEDGLVTDEEARRLEAMRTRLGLSQEEMDILLKEGLDGLRGKALTHCPHCQKSLNTTATEPHLHGDPH